MGTNASDQERQGRDNGTQRNSKNEFRAERCYHLRSQDDRNAGTSAATTSTGPLSLRDTEASPTAARSVLAVTSVHGRGA